MVSKKKDDVKDLKLRDLKQANIIIQIELLVTDKKRKFVEVDKILFLHPINRKSALEKTQKRIEKLKRNFLGDEKELTKKDLDKIIPSITDMKIVAYKDNFVIWEGNGRLMAIKKVFKKDLKVEVVEYVLDEVGRKIVEKLLDDLFQEG